MYWIKIILMGKGKIISMGKNSFKVLKVNKVQSK